MSRPAPTGTTSLRSRWNRAFALLFVVLLIGAMANFGGTRLLVGTFRGAAVRVERDATLLAQLRADIITHLILITHTTVPVADQQALTALDRSIRSDFAAAIANADRPERLLLQDSYDQWQAIAASMGPTDHLVPAAQRAAAAATGAPPVVSLLDQAGTVARAGVRSDLANAQALDDLATASMVAISLLALLLMLRLARRLSSDVLRPVGQLRDSANHLAVGELGYRVHTGRADELGDLASSFNAMADAIAADKTRLIRQANHDPLTGLANRAAFRVRLEAALGQTERRDRTQAVLFVDLDDFKDVNDTLGHAAGDDVLGVVAARLTTAVRPGDLVARLGGDEFAVLLDGVSDAAAAFSVAERAVEALAAPLQVGDIWVHVGASIGLAMRHDESDPDTLMSEADVAMYTAKGRGKNRVERYDARVQRAAIDHQALKADLGDVAARGELVAEYQPIVHLTTGRLVGVEALVRWQHPTRGLLAPAEFIDLAEQTGGIVGIGSWVLETSARQLRRWQRRYRLPNLTLAVNVSACQLHRPGFADEVRDILRRVGVSPGSLILEITESVLADPAKGAAESLRDLRALGVRIALDDFGTGYSSMAYLSELPVDVLKVDRAFVSGEHAGGTGGVLLEAIVGLADNLGLDVVPEGIEQPDQLARLRALGCQTGQGFLMSRPASAASIDDLLTSRASLLPETVATAEVVAPLLA